MESDWVAGAIPITGIAVASGKMVPCGEVEGIILERIFGVFQKEKDAWNLTHRPTGLKIWTCETKAQACHIAEALLTVEGVKWKNKTLSRLTKKQNIVVSEIFKSHGLVWNR